MWRAGRTSALWDVRRISSLSKLTYLVLASGFSGMRHMEAWPPGCKRLVWTCPSDAHSSRLSMPAVPPNISLQVSMLLRDRIGQWAAGSDVALWVTMVVVVVFDNVCLLHL